jgi:hypothetical protein
MYPSSDITDQISNMLISSSEELQEHQALHALSLRIPLELAANLIAMAEQAGVSRNEMARLLMQAGVQAVLARLPPQTAAEICESAADRYESMI